jgi:hypothetical protein
MGCGMRKFVNNLAFTNTITVRWKFAEMELGGSELHCAAPVAAGRLGRR